MTENEAIEVLKNNYPKTCKMVNGRYQGGFDNTECDFGQALTIAISALKEIQQYRSMDERLSEVYGENNGLLKTLVEYILKWKSENKAGEMPPKTIMLTDEDVDRWKAYKEIGTVEECREAVEKQKPKIIRIKNWSPSNCPTCDYELSTHIEDGYYKHPIFLKMCPECGQAIQWDLGIRGNGR